MLHLPCPFDQASAASFLMAMAARYLILEKGKQAGALWKSGRGHFLHGETRRFHWDRCWSRKSGTLTLPIWPDWLANFGKDRDLLSIFSSSFFLFLEMVGFITKTGYTAKIAISIGKIASNQWGLTIYHCVYIYIQNGSEKQCKHQEIRSISP